MEKTKILGIIPHSINPDREELRRAYEQFKQGLPCRLTFYVGWWRTRKVALKYFDNPENPAALSLRIEGLYFQKPHYFLMTVNYCHREPGGRGTIEYRTTPHTTSRYSK